MNSRDKILKAATNVFVQKGLEGARMQEIADIAGVNKAMLYYYFRSKEDLFNAVFKEFFIELFGSIQNLLPSQKGDVAELVKQFVSLHIDFLAQHPNMPKIITREIHSSNPAIKKVMKEIFQDSNKANVAAYFKIMAEAQKSGSIRKVDAQQTLWNIIALDLFYFALKPIVQTFWEKECKDEKKMLKKRKQAIVDLLLYGLLPREGKK